MYGIQLVLPTVVLVYSIGFKGGLLILLDQICHLGCILYLIVEMWHHFLCSISTFMVTALMIWNYLLLISKLSIVLLGIQLKPILWRCRCPPLTNTFIQPASFLVHLDYGTHSLHLASLLVMTCKGLSLISIVIFQSPLDFLFLRSALCLVLALLPCWVRLI